MKVPYVNLGAQAAEVKSELLSAAERVIDSGHYVLSPECTEFEKRFAKTCQANAAVGVNSGTDALILTLKAMEIGPGDEVITVSNTFIATVAAIELVGAKPVLVDIAEDLNMDPEKLPAAITKNTKAIVPVHLTGRPCKMDRILELAGEQNIPVIEDAAQSFGAEFDGNPVGSMGIAGTFSLHPLKNLFAYGDAGMITCQSEHFAGQIHKIKNHGLANRNESDFFSVNSRLDPIQAAFLQVQLDHLPEWEARRRAVAEKLNEGMAGVVRVPRQADKEKHVYQTYMIRCERRDALMEHLVSNGVDAKIHYPDPIHRQRAAAHLNITDAMLPETAKASHEIMSLPIYPTMSDEQAEHVIATVKSFYQG